jgi:hypothetical protein
MSACVGLVTGGPRKVTGVAFEDEGLAQSSNEEGETVDSAPTESPSPFPLAGLPAEAKNEAVPGSLFDANFYLAQLPDPAEASEAPRKHFAQHGRTAGWAPSLGAVYIGEAIRERARVSETPMRDIVWLLPAHKRHLAKTEEVWKRLRFCAHPRFYSAQFPASELKELGGEFDVNRAVSHYLAHGVHEGKRLCALFNPDWYLEQLHRAGIEVAKEGAPFLGWLASKWSTRTAERAPFFHWLTVGWNWRIVPTPLFHEGFYEERYPDIVTSYPWGFIHFVRRGCYEPDRLASPNGRHHPGGADPQAAELQSPLLLREMLHRAEDYDLSRTSWAEEGALAARAKYDALRSARMRELVAKAAKIEPLVLRPYWNYPVANARPHRSRRLFLDRQAEELRRAVGRAHVDTVVLVPGGTASAIAAPLDRLLAHAASDSLLIVATDTGGTAEKSRAPKDAYLDLLPFLDGMEQDFRLDLLLDLVRGLTAERIIVVGSKLGWQLLAAYGRQLSARASLGAYVPSTEGGLGLRQRPRLPRRTGAGAALRNFQQCFAHLDWALVDTEDQAKKLIDRYAMPTAVAKRLVPLGKHAVERAFDLPRRRRHV